MFRGRGLRKKKDVFAIVRKKNRDRKRYIGLNYAAPWPSPEAVMFYRAEKKAEKRGLALARLILPLHQNFYKDAKKHFR